VSVVNPGVGLLAFTASLNVIWAKPVNYNLDNSPVTYVVTVKNTNTSAINTYGITDSLFGIFTNLPANNAPKILPITNTYQISVKAIAYGLTSAVSNVITISITSPAV
jgi:hypothetical protein